MSWHMSWQLASLLLLGGSTVPGRDVLFALWQPDGDHIVKSARAG